MCGMIVTELENVTVFRVMCLCFTEWRSGNLSIASSACVCVTSYGRLLKASGTTFLMPFTWETLY